MSVFRASRSPCIQRSTQRRSSLAGSGRGNEPEPAPSRSERNAPLSSSRNALASIQQTSLNGWFVSHSARQVPDVPGPSRAPFSRLAVEPAQNAPRIPRRGSSSLSIPCLPPVIELHGDILHAGLEEAFVGADHAASLLADGVGSPPETNRIGRLLFIRADLCSSGWATNAMPFIMSCSSPAVGNKARQSGSSL